MIELIGCFLFFPALCAVTGAVIGGRKEASLIGAVLGFFLGPIGLVIAIFVDSRPRCPACREHIATGAILCPHCRSDLAQVWAAQQKQYSEWIARQNALAEHHGAEQARLAETKRRDREQRRISAATDARWHGNSFWVFVIVFRNYLVDKPKHN